MKKFSFTINGNEYNIEIKNVEDTIAEVEVNGVTHSVEFDRTLETTKTPKLIRPEAIPSTDITPTEQKTNSPSTPKGAGYIKSPLPGTILESLCENRRYCKIRGQTGQSGSYENGKPY